jgi:RNA polymerase sigma factor (sigma-70 family)
MELTDEALMLAVSEGDRRKLGILFERHHIPLYEFFCRMTGNRAASEDLVQEVFIRILKYGDTFRNESRFTTWMYRIARNVQFSYYKKHQGEALTAEFSAVSAYGGSPSQTLERNQEAELLRRALFKLSEDKRELLVLARYREMKHEEIAAILGVEVNTVKVRVHRAMKELREMFGEVSGESVWNVKRSETTLQII